MGLTSASKGPEPVTPGPNETRLRPPPAPAVVAADAASGTPPVKTAPAPPSDKVNGFFAVKGVAAPSIDKRRAVGGTTSLLQQ